MGILGSLFGKKDTTSQQVVEVQVTHNAAALDMVAEHLKQRYGRPSIHIAVDSEKEPALTDSKFGGFPYWDLRLPYPQTPRGENLMLLAQINLSEIKLMGSPLPSRGILQFFIEASPDYGADLDDGTRQNGFRVVYHRDVDHSATAANVKAAGIPANTQLDRKSDAFPFTEELAVSFSYQVDFINSSADEYDEAVLGALRELFDEQTDKNLWKYLPSSEYDYLDKKSGAWGHKMLGYPSFTQCDPRSADSEFDTLLFQMDSDMDTILWGDCGIANFFINSENLRNGDFSRVMYTWDCG